MPSRRAFFALLLLVLNSIGHAQTSIPTWVTEGPFVSEQQISFELPMESLASKLYVDVKIGGESYRFVFDTGSPSMISSSLAEELGLAVVDTRVGKDSHGADVKTDIVQADLDIGGVTFHKVPVYAADFSGSKALQCLIGDGVLGSEILPLCIWQIDLPESTLRCTTDLSSLDHIDDARRLDLYDFGYPHSPIFDIGFAKDAKSKAMFDTGSPSYLAISPPDFEGARKSRALTKLNSGYGSLGGSLGGQAPDGEQLRAELKSFSIGDLEIGRLGTVMRESPPSLVGASFLEHFVLTLDVRGNTAYADMHNGEGFVRPSFGFSLGFEDRIFVSLVWEDSEAEKAGLRAGQSITSINGVDVEYTCGGMQRAIEAMNGEEIEIAWEGGSATFARQAHP